MPMQDSNQFFFSEFVFPELDWHDIGMLTELFACRQALYKSYGAILSEIMECVNKDVVSCRTKALRAIRRIATSTPEILDDVGIGQRTRSYAVLISTLS